MFASLTYFAGVNLHRYHDRRAHQTVQRKRLGCWALWTPPSASRRAFLSGMVILFTGLAIGGWNVFSEPPTAFALKGVNRPDLLPSGPVQKLIDRERFLVTGQRARVEREIDALEKQCGVKIRILTQRYPETPGLAIKDYWGVDDDTVVMVVDYFGGVGNVLKFNIGANVDRQVSPRFWSRIASKYGNKFYLEQNGIDQAILNAFDDALAEIRATCEGGTPAGAVSGPATNRDHR
ncbi:hypothetical protein CCYA_CCYA03G0886 [Cyanidiococcus yangmingshanensis]|nr:hypothetical protein CCYA_CCYA03G0886 [Cyanidiococcus yangmingshanensis]